MPKQFNKSYPKQIWISQSQLLNKKIAFYQQAVIDLTSYTRKHPQADLKLSQWNHKDIKQIIEKESSFSQKAISIMLKYQIGKITPKEKKNIRKTSIKRQSRLELQQSNSSQIQKKKVRFSIKQQSTPIKQKLIELPDKKFNRKVSKKEKLLFIKQQKKENKSKTKLQFFDEYISFEIKEQLIAVPVFQVKFLKEVKMNTQK